MGFLGKPSKSSAWPEQKKSGVNYSLLQKTIVYYRKLLFTAMQTGTMRFSFTVKKNVTILKLEILIYYYKKLW